MNDEADILEILALPSGETGVQTPREKPRASSQFAPTEETTIALTIERDLAVVLVRADAGRCGRIWPHSTMTYRASPQETLHVRTLLDPFLRDEIRRVNVDKTHSPTSCTVRAILPQALSLKAFCVRYAAFIREHLARDPEDDRIHRSRQRLGASLPGHRPGQRGVGRRVRRRPDPGTVPAGGRQAGRGSRLRFGRPHGMGTVRIGGVLDHAPRRASRGGATLPAPLSSALT